MHETLRPYQDGGDTPGDNTAWIAGGIVVVLAIIGVAVYAVKFREP